MLKASNIALKIISILRASRVCVETAYNSNLFKTVQKKCSLLNIFVQLRTRKHLKNAIFRIIGLWHRFSLKTST